MKRTLIIGTILILFASLTMQSCSRKTCPAYNTYPKTKRLR
ncbi:hypothetical protein ACMGDE_02460 [Parapedobacter sp. DT-150]